MAVMNITVSQEEQYQIPPERSDMVRPPPRFTHDVKDSLVMKMNEAGGSGEASRIFKWFVTITTLQRTCQMMMMLMFTRYVTYYLIVQLLLMPVTSHIFFTYCQQSGLSPFITHFCIDVLAQNCKFESFSLVQYHVKLLIAHIDNSSTLSAIGPQLVLY